MSNLSKLVDARLKLLVTVLSDLAVHGPSLPPIVAAALESPACGPAVKTLLDAATALLQKRGEGLKAADLAHLAELLDDPARRDVRDATSAALYDALVDTRDAVRSAWGPAAVRDLGFLGETPSDPVLLDRLAAAIIEKLSTYRPGPPRNPRLKIDVPGLRADLEAARRPATAALEALAVDARENEVTLRARNDALAGSDRAVSIASGLLTTFAKTAGDADLADRLSSGKHRAGPAEAEPAPEPLAPTA